MKRQVITKQAPEPLAGAYSQGLVVDEKRMYVAGQGPMNVKSGLTPQGVSEQTTQVMENIKAILEAGDFSLADVVKSTVHLADIGDFGEFNKVYTSYFNGVLPVRTTVQSVLPKIDMLVEIDVIAEK